MGYVRNAALIFFTLLHFLSAGQNKKVSSVVSAAIESNTFPFSSGTVYLDDGHAEEGQLQYNALEEFLVVQVAGESKTYYPAKISGFSFMDEKIGQERTYVTLPWENPANNLVQPAFFEILREFKNFSLLSTRHVLEADEKAVSLLSYHTYNKTQNSGFRPLGTKTRIRYQETICFFDEDRKLESYLTTVDTEKDGLITNESSSRQKNVDADLVRKYTGAYFEKLRKFAKENHLDFEKKQDMLTILDYYGTLLIR